MAQHYTDTSREHDPHSLPDLEVWEDTITVITSNCGVFRVGRNSEAARGFCPSCDRATCVHDITVDDDSGIVHTTEKGWFYWFCLPGCLPDSEPMGPFETEAEALSDARNGYDETDTTIEP